MNLQYKLSKTATLIVVLAAALAIIVAGVVRVDRILVLPERVDKIESHNLPARVTVLEADKVKLDQHLESIDQKLDMLLDGSGNSARRIRFIECLLKHESGPDRLDCELDNLD